MNIYNPAPVALTAKKYSEAVNVHNGVWAGGTTFTDLDLSGTIGTGVKLVMLKVITAAAQWVAVRQNGSSVSMSGTLHGAAACADDVNTTNEQYIVTMTDENGVVELAMQSSGSVLTVDVMGWL